MTRVHPELMSKPVLIAQLKEAAAAARKWEARCRLAQYEAKAAKASGRERTVEEIWDEAHAVFVVIGTDPDAGRHVQDLLDELDSLCTHGRCFRPADVCPEHSRSALDQVAS